MWARTARTDGSSQPVPSFGSAAVNIKKPRSSAASATGHAWTIGSERARGRTEEGAREGIDPAQGGGAVEHEVDADQDPRDAERARAQRERFEHPPVEALLHRVAVIRRAPRAAGRRWSRSRCATGRGARSDADPTRR